MTKSSMGRKGLISAYNSQITPHASGKSGQKLKAGMRRQELMETMEGCYLLPYLSWVAQPAFLYTSGPPAQRWHLPQRAGPFLFITSRNMSHRLGIGPVL